MAQLKTAEVLAFERKLANSDGLLYGGSWQDIDRKDSWKAISVNLKTVRGTHSSRFKPTDPKMSDPLKLNKDVASPNPHTVDSAALPFDADTLKVSFTLRVLGNLHIPSACNKPDYQAALSQVIESYKQEQGFVELAKRYATNLASGRFLWRNRVGAEAVEVHVTQLQDNQPAQQWRFNASQIPLHHFNTEHPDISALTHAIAAGLKGDAFTFFKVDAYVRLGEGQEVYPSEELILDSSNSKGRKSKTLYQVQSVAAMHSQKIGNALRTIDTWYPQSDEFGPISVEPFGSVTSRGKAYRPPGKGGSGLDFYTLLDNWVLHDKAPTPEQQHYVMATLIRGGVFGEKSE